MSCQPDYSVASSEQIERALCRRLARIRLSRNVTQAHLAREAGVSPRTIGRMEKGLGVTLETFIRVLTALGIQQNLKALLPDPAVRPIERIDIGGVERKRARPARSGEASRDWTWGDEVDGDG